MSWWDYGYQITAMANRTILVDNNTWNNTHISRVGQAMASTEDKAYEIMRELDVDYVLVIFGGLTGYSSDGKLLFPLNLNGSSNDNYTFQILTSSYGWSALAAAPIVVHISKKPIIMHPAANFVSTKKVRQHCSIV